MVILYAEIELDGAADRMDPRSEELLGSLVRRGSFDPDVLYLERRRLLVAARAESWRGGWMICFGGLLTATLIGALVGAPLLWRGGRRLRRARRELRAIDRSFAAFERSGHQRVAVEPHSARCR